MKIMFIHLFGLSYLSRSRTHTHTSDDVQLTSPLQFGRTCSRAIPVFGRSAKVVCGGGYCVALVTRQLHLNVHRRGRVHIGGIILATTRRKMHATEPAYAGVCLILEMESSVTTKQTLNIKSVSFGAAVAGSRALREYMMSSRHPFR